MIALDYIVIREIYKNTQNEAGYFCCCCLSRFRTVSVALDWYALKYQFPTPGCLVEVSNSGG